MKSVVHTIPGLPIDIEADKRVFLFTAWCPKAITHARAKVLLKHKRPDLLKMQRHLGMDGLTGPEWWSFTACLDVPFVVANRFERMPLRYGLDRWVWTRASETLAD